jgi:hypothetical protein
MLTLNEIYQNPKTPKPQNPFKLEKQRIYIQLLNKS